MDARREAELMVGRYLIHDIEWREALIEQYSEIFSQHFLENNTKCDKAPNESHLFAGPLKSNALPVGSASTLRRDHASLDDLRRVPASLFGSFGSAGTQYKH